MINHKNAKEDQRVQRSTKTGAARPTNATRLKQKPGRHNHRILLHMARCIGQREAIKNRPDTQHSIQARKSLDSE